MADTTPTAPVYRFRYATLIIAIVIFGQLQLPHVSFSQMASSAYQNLANVSSINAAVPPNEYNTLAQQFSEKDRELTAREQELIAREKALDAKYQEEIASTKRTTLLTILGATVILILLILANFYFDIKREEERERVLRAERGESSPL
jgi:hypothetical protein